MVVDAKSFLQNKKKPAIQNGITGFFVAEEGPPPAALASHKCVALVRPLAVPEKIIGRFALILDFFDRCAETTCASSAPGGACLSQVRCTCSPSCGALKNRRTRRCLIF